MFKTSSMKKLIGVTIFIALLGGTFMVPAASAQSGGMRGLGALDQAVTVPTLEYPKGTVHIDNLMYLWVAVSSATEYQIQARDSSSSTVLNEYYDSTDCSSGTCLARPGDILSDDDYSWRARAYVSGTWRNWSSYQSFTVDTDGTGTGFSSNFNSNHSGWSILKGTWSHESGAYFTTWGVAGKAASIAHSNNYSTLTYEVRMKRLGSSNSCANALLIRGDADQDSWGWWDQSYTFNYVNYSGYGGPAYAVTRDHNGTYYNLTDPNNSSVLWKSTSRVNSAGWNTLKVTASGSHLKFYINGTLVWSGTNSYYSSGRVGVALYRNTNSCGDKFYLDWAELDTSVPDMDMNEMLEEDQVVLVGGDHNMAP